jgi:ubiquitin-like protein Nedd8
MPNLKIKTITNRELCVNYEENYTVKMLKESIEHKEGMPVDQFKLIVSGQQMDEAKNLVDYKVTPGTFVIMVPSLRG